MKEMTTQDVERALEALGEQERQQQQPLPVAFATPAAAAAAPPDVPSIFVPPPPTTQPQPQPHGVVVMSMTNPNTGETTHFSRGNNNNNNNNNNNGSAGSTTAPPPQSPHNHDHDPNVIGNVFGIPLRVRKRGSLRCMAVGGVVFLSLVTMIMMGLGISTALHTAQFDKDHQIADNGRSMGATPVNETTWSYQEPHRSKITTVYDCSYTIYYEFDILVDDDGRTTTTTITGSQTMTSRDQDGGKTRDYSCRGQGVYRDRDSFPKAGENIAIHYNPNDPWSVNYYYVPGNYGWGQAIGLIIVSVVCLGVAVMLCLWLSRHPKNTTCRPTRPLGTK